MQRCGRGDEPQSEWILQFIYPGRAVLNYFLDYRAFDSVTIDGTTQTAFTGDTNPDGNEVALYGTNLYLLADNSVLIGFDAGQMAMSGSNGTISGNSGGLHIDVFGDNNSISDNAAGTIKISGGNDNIVTGNSMQRVRIWNATGTRVGGPTLADRNFITGYGTFNSEGIPSGTDIELFQTQGTWIENNYIGTTPDGMAQGHPYSNVGIEFKDGNVGTVVKDNLIAGILGIGQFKYAGTLWGWAILFQGTGSDIELVGNTIGLDAAGAPTLPSVWGVDIGHSSYASYTDVRVGGYGTGEGNTIAGHYFNGVTVGEAIPNVRIAGNSIYGNGISAGGFDWLGIDLIPSLVMTGVTPNDSMDADLGGNGLQNYPVLVSATSETGGTRISGTLDSAASQSYTLEFFASAMPSAAGFGEGELSLGTAAVSTDGAGHASFAGLFASAPDGWTITATATLEPIGATSEFSSSIPAASGVTCALDQGYGGPGTARLSICGEPMGTGQTAMLHVDGAVPDAPIWLIVGSTYAPTPVGAVTFVPVPGKLIRVGSTDAIGAFELGPINGGGGPATAFAQALYLDASQPDLFSLTNAIQVDLLP